MNLLNKLRSVYQYVSNMGYTWFLFRLKYELLKRISYFDRVNSSILKKLELTSINEFKYHKIYLVNENYKADFSFKEKADNASLGKIFSFSHEYLDYSDGNILNWHINPISKVESNRNLSWNNLPDFGEYGDIKLIWEASRFPQVYFFINAYSISHEEKYAKECISQIISWIKNNPYPKGVNYKCGQEISFRIFSWIVALDYFNDFFREEEKSDIVRNIYISLLRVNANINYAAKSVKNNHSISEAAGLFIGGLLFPQFKESKQFIKKGIKYLSYETNYQIYKDGSYIQHSFTYQRLALDVLSFLMLVAKRKNFILPEEIKSRHNDMIIFLNSFVQENGYLPNYGSNDGANLFPLSADNYRDFRNSLNFANIINNKLKIFDSHADIAHFFNLKSDIFDKKEKKKKFTDGGYFILENNNIFAFIRSHTYRDRPASNDMFHLDIWVNGKNIFCDTGSYSYNTDKSFKNNFIGVIGHNTIMINNNNQMEQVLNFGWSNWTKADTINFNENSFSGKNYSYVKKFGVLHFRDIKLEDDKITIVDDINNITTKTNIKQIWNTKSKVEIIDMYTLKVDNCKITSNTKYKIEKSYISEYYNSYDTGTKIIFEIDIEKNYKIKTTMDFN
ncbi:MAG: hypothetical protein C0625_12255 [Arcobacter sp.]|nr:MAG: hypothetical protein C0625_12255 [Arcobacter sp.]